MGKQHGYNSTGRGYRWNENPGSRRGRKRRQLVTGEAGPGNHEFVGYVGMAQAVRGATSQALVAAGLKLEGVSAAGLGVAGYDWPSQRWPVLDVLAELGFSMPLEIVNDTILGLLAGSDAGWGLAVGAGTHCNCWGWDRTHQRVGHVTRGGCMLGKHAGGSELVQKAVQALAYEWTHRGPATALTPLFVAHAGAIVLAGQVAARAGLPVWLPDTFNQDTDPA